jgi:hypothetical protein
MAVRLAAILAVFALALPGCGLVSGTAPTYSADSIYADADQDPSPALDRPYLETGAPSGESNTQATVVAHPALLQDPRTPEPQPVKPFESMVVSRTPPGAQVWIDGHRAAINTQTRSGEVAWEISTEPTVRFLLHERLGRFRAITIQIYLLDDQDKIESASGITVTEAGEVATMRPARKIFLPRPGGDVVITRVRDGAVLPWFTLDYDQHYEVQFIVGGTEGAEALSIRVKTIAKGRQAQPTSQPDNANPDRPALPEGVIIPGQP